jgi:hypothetical protein
LTLRDTTRIDQGRGDRNKTGTRQGLTEGCEVGGSRLGLEQYECKYDIQVLLIMHSGWVVRGMARALCTGVDGPGRVGGKVGSHVVRLYKILG